MTFSAKRHARLHRGQTRYTKSNTKRHGRQTKRYTKSNTKRYTKSNTKRYTKSKTNRQKGGIFGLFEKKFTNDENRQLMEQFPLDVLKQITYKEKRQIIDYINNYNELKNKILIIVRDRNNNCTKELITEFEKRIMTIDLDRRLGKAGFEEAKAAYITAKKDLNSILVGIEYDCISTD